MSLKKINAGNFVDVEVRLDGKHYISCVFTRCTFLYDGGEFQIEDFLAMEGCSLRLGDAAMRTLELLRVFKLLRFDGALVKLVLPD